MTTKQGRLAAYAPVWLFAVRWGVGFATGAFGFIRLRIVTGKMSDSFSRLLDEREREWRHRGATMLVTAGTVPSLILGWTLPDDDPEDFLEPGDGA
jgi:hypothetical protein